MWTRLLLTSLCLLSVLATKSSFADKNSGVLLTLQHSIDSNCDGAMGGTEQAVPGSCIIYEVTALNSGPITYQDILISTRIPLHTTLVQAYSHVDHQAYAPLTSNVIPVQHGHLLQTKLATLQPGQDNKLTLRYLVKIN